MEHCNSNVVYDSSPFAAVRARPTRSFIVQLLRSIISSANGSFASTAYEQNEFLSQNEFVAIIYLSIYHQRGCYPQETILECPC